MVVFDGNPLAFPCVAKDPDTKSISGGDLTRIKIPGASYTVSEYYTGGEVTSKISDIISTI